MGGAMSGGAPIVIRLVAEPGPNGFWPRENYFEGGAANGSMTTITGAPSGMVSGSLGAGFSSAWAASESASEARARKNEYFMGSGW